MTWRKTLACVILWSTTGLCLAGFAVVLCLMGTWIERGCLIAGLVLSVLVGALLSWAETVVKEEAS